MTFVNVSLLLGGILAAAPILIHLMMRRQPRRMVFPAIRYVVERLDANRRTLQLRHWLLLALRCLLLILLAMAFARPNIRSARAGEGVFSLAMLVLGIVGFGALMVAVQKRLGRIVIGLVAGIALLLVGGSLFGLTRLMMGAKDVLSSDTEAPVAAVILVDAAVHMEYQQQNQSRLARAQEIARWILKQLPPDSRVAVVDSHHSELSFAVDLSAADRSIERLGASGVTRSLTDVLADSIQMLKTSERERHEVYVLSDLVRSSWPLDSPAIQKVLDEASGALIYVVDIGVELPKNAALDEIRLSAERLPRGGKLRLDSAVTSVGMPDVEAAVELHLDREDPARPVVVDGQTRLPETDRRGREIVRLTADGSQPVSFEMDGLAPGIHHGYLQLNTDDGLPSDNRRYFSVSVQEAWRVLVATGPDGTASRWMEALAPSPWQKQGQTQFDCQSSTCAALPNENLDDFAVVCLLDPEPLTADTWELLFQYAQRGGSLAIFWGHNSAESVFEIPVVPQLVGYKFVRQWRSTGRELLLAPTSYDHPVLAEFRPIATSVPWDDFPIYRHWDVGELGPQTQVIASYSNRRPAILETTVGAGRVLSMTTPLSEPNRLKGRASWNDLFASDRPWPAVVLANEMLLYLVQRGSVKLNYVSGDNVSLPNDTLLDPERYQLFLPGEMPVDVVARDGRVPLGNVDRPGIYYLKGSKGKIVARGVSVNFPRPATSLERLDRPQLDQVLGANRYRLARSIDEITREVGEARIGREFYPYLMLLVVVILALEYLLANRFYQSGAGRMADPSPQPSRRVA